MRDNAAGKPMIVGYGIVFNSDSSDMGFVEQVDPGAVTKTLQEADVRALANHDADWLLGRSKSGTLRLTRDNIGVRYEIDVNVNDPDGQRALEKVRRGDMDGASFCFETVRDEWNWEAQPPQRRLQEIRLIDIGPVTYPAYPDSTAAARALQPIADRCGKPVDELVSAMQRGEIRSMIESEEVEDGRRAETLEAEVVVGLESRAGKMLSAANAALVRAALETLQGLLATAEGSDIADDDGDEANALPLDAELRASVESLAAEFTTLVEDAPTPEAREDGGMPLYLALTAIREREQILSAA